jgi:hypothetical protein
MENCIEPKCNFSLYRNKCTKPNSYIEAIAWCKRNNKDHGECRVNYNNNKKREKEIACDRYYERLNIQKKPKCIYPKCHFSKLRNKCVVYMLENRFQIEEDASILETSNTDGPEVFNIILKLGNETICHRVIDAKVYPPKVRYTLDVRPSIKNILRDLTDILSDKNLSYTYLNYSFA